MKPPAPSPLDRHNAPMTRDAFYRQLALVEAIESGLFPKPRWSSDTILSDEFAHFEASFAATGNGPSGYHRTESAGIGPLAPATPPYGPMCRNPDACAGKGYCPLDPTCGD